MEVKHVYISKERMIRFVNTVNSAFRSSKQLSLEKCIKDGLSVGMLKLKVLTVYPNTNIFRRLYPNGTEENGKWVVK